MKHNNDRRNFIVKAASTVAVGIIGGSLASCRDSMSPTPAEFKYGVASGDPLTDRVILWTHAKILNSTSSVNLAWQVATDANFANVVSSGRVAATQDNAFTAKVDATGLSAGNTYYYRFTDDAQVVSPVGITRTLPGSSVALVKFAVFSCTLYAEGFFNVYDAAVKSDAQYALHLGDYIYEYGSDPTKFGNKDAVTLGRVVSPANDIVTLDDYRTRYALYRSDPNLQALHAKMPWITIWDDHEFANNAFMTGAENHNPASQGDWITRKNIAAKVYHEWMPIRTPDPANLLKIYRSFDFGSLFSLHMLDTRIEGRMQQYANYGDPLSTPSYKYADYVAGLTPVNGVMPDAARTMISTTQFGWLTNNLATSKATWQFLGNQDIMARMWLPASVLNAQIAALTAATVASASPTTTNLQAAQAAATSVQTAISDYLTAKATRLAAGVAALTPTQGALLDATRNPRLPYNLDSWDGYPLNREAILQTVKAQGKKLVTLSGDSHNAWFTNLTTLNGSKVGVEFAGSSVTAPGFESQGLGTLASSLDGSALVPQLGNAAIGAGLGLIDDLNYADTNRRGYILMTVTPDAVKGEYVFVDTVKKTQYTASVGRTITVAATNEAITYA
jgi:alkaline phosphatase D